MGHDLRSLSARSVVLSLLLGHHPARLSARELVRAGDLLGVSESSLRVALTRMVAAGDLVREGTDYGLSARLSARQRRQDEAVDPALRAWDGSWDMFAVTAVGREAADRVWTRKRLVALRHGELREGLWLRPANLAAPWPVEMDSLGDRFLARPDGDVEELVARLWDLPAWQRRSELLLSWYENSTAPIDRFTVAAAIVRQLLADPVLPVELVPAGWLGSGLRSAYADYRVELSEFAESLPR